MAARVYDEVFGYIEDATKTLPGAAAPGELPGELVTHTIHTKSKKISVGLEEYIQYNKIVKFMHCVKRIVFVNES